MYHFNTHNSNLKGELGMEGFVWGTWKICVGSLDIENLFISLPLEHVWLGQ